MHNDTSIDGIVLFSGGLDSILSARLLADQGLTIRCLHVVSPFFGSPSSCGRWKRLYGVDVEVLDAGEAMAALVNGWPPHGFGKVMNPCVDCKITLLRLAKKRMLELGASFIATGEVMGQRPMSQRRDVMNTIQREAGVEGLLLRPLSAQHLQPTPVEESGLVDRSRLLAIHGRGRQEQLALAASYGFSEIPTPGGGCWLTERENARRYWPLRTRRKEPDAQDYRLAALGRQYWLMTEQPACWLVIGRNSHDNENLKRGARPGDLLAGLCDYPGPLSLLRDGASWQPSAVQSACALAASYSPKGVAAGIPLRFWLRQADGAQRYLGGVQPDIGRSAFTRMSWEEVRAEKHAIASEQARQDEAEREIRRLAGAISRAVRRDSARPDWMKDRIKLPENED